MSGLDCIPISMYCQQTGETIDAINKRIQRGVWREGLQVLKIDGVKERWIDLIEVNVWARRKGRNGFVPN
ncbi:MAG: excisionase [Rouxiella badensis]|uniref:excisionase n=1 Tax=Rouxiella badensis TaxID=1646377 RepID=UPI003C5AF7FD